MPDIPETPALVAEITEVVTSSEFDQFVFDKYFTRVSDFAEALIDESTFPSKDFAAKASDTMQTMETFMHVFLHTPPSDNEVDAFVGDVMKMFVQDMTPMFHAYVVDALSKTDTFKTKGDNA